MPAAATSSRLHRSHCAVACTPRLSIPLWRVAELIAEKGGDAVDLTNLSWAEIEVFTITENVDCVRETCRQAFPRA